MTKEDAFSRLGKSKFRSRFKLNDDEKAYVAQKGMDVIRKHAVDFVEMKLAPAKPLNDGKQTPMRGHPVFKAMHATAMCCRGCMEKWWRVKRNVPLTELQKQKVVEFLIAWITRQI